MKVSIVTAAFNNEATINDTIESVLAQNCNLEYIIVDGKSLDKTCEIVNSYSGKIDKFISEPDNGIYSALNKGIKLATGDIIGILHADDIYANSKVLEQVVAIFEKSNADAIYGDLLYVDKEDTNKVSRYWRSGKYSEKKMKIGWMPPHPTFFVKTQVYEKYGGFNETFSIAADYELMIRFLLINNISVEYLPEILVKMRMGGVSNRSLKQLIKKTREDFRVWKIHDISNPIKCALYKNLSKINQFFDTSFD